MTVLTSAVNRRHWLCSTGLVAASVALPCMGQSSKLQLQKNPVIAQIIDVSQAQQDVSKDFLVGSRAAWQAINQRGGIRGKQVQHVAIETDGSPESIRTALNAVKSNSSCIVMSGSCGDQLASQLVMLNDQDGLQLAHVAPWLQNSRVEIDNHTFPIFAARQEQIAHALKTLSVMGVSELAAIYGTSRDHSAYHLEVGRIAAAMQLKLQSFQAGAELRQLGQRLTNSTPAVLLFVGGTPELAEFTKGLEKQARQRYIVALADVNLQTLMQMGAARSTPTIATQPVTMVNSSMPVVRL